MYKVFINNRPIFLVDISENTNSLEYDKLVKFEEPIKAAELLGEYAENKAKMVLCVVVDSDNPLKTFFAAHQYIEAAGGVVRNDRNEILTIFRNGCWDLPKGKVEEGEEVEVAAVREVEEECGIHGHEIGTELPSTYHTYTQKGTLYLKRTYWYNMQYQGHETLIPQTEEGITAVVWKSEDEMGEVLSNTYQSIKEVLANSK
jgi:8-oxo-dGTP pyrophosphatase MutT (NUDIX family)